MDFRKAVKIRAKWAQGLAAGLAGAVLALALFLPGLLDTWEAKTWDWRVNLSARPSPQTDKIRLIMLDQSSLDWGKENGLSWPWPREVYAKIAEFCRRAQVKALAFDVLYTEPSKYGVSDDQALGKALKILPTTIAASLSRHSGSEKNWPPSAFLAAIKINGLDDWINKTGYQVFQRGSFPVPELAYGALMLANVQLNPDSDNVYRRASFFEVFAGRPMPSLALANYLASKPDANISIQQGKITVDDREIVIDKRGQAILNYRGPAATHKRYNAADIIISEVNLQSGEKPVLVDIDDFKNTYVFFGFSAPGLFDLRPTPVSGVYPGVEISATMLDNLLAGDFIRPVSLLIVVAMTFLLALCAGLATSYVNGIARNILLYLLFLTLPVGLSLIAYNFNFWLPLVVGEMGVAFTLVGSGLIYYTTEGRQKQFIKSAFKQYLSPAVIEQIIAHPERLKLGGERKTISIFFSDLEGFTGISEKLDPEALTELLNTYLSAMTDIIHEDGGTVDKYEGDAIIAFWNAPLDQPDHAVRCVRAALRCQQKLEEMRPDFHNLIGRSLNMRIGLNTGIAVVGNMGSRFRFDYTMIGDAVNLAARLEGINKQFGTSVMMSQATYDQIGDAFPSREISRVSVVGRREPVIVYEPMLSCRLDEARRRQLEIFSEALRLFYRGDFAAAGDFFAQIAGDDKVADKYFSKCQELLANPPTNWQGVWALSAK